VPRSAARTDQPRTHGAVEELFRSGSVAWHAPGMSRRRHRAHRRHRGLCTDAASRVLCTGVTRESTPGTDR
jgi:hypothetical protein